MRNNKQITIQRPDKGGGTVILDTSDYQRKLNNILLDNSKFKECNSEQSTAVKKKINVIAENFKNSNETIYKLLKRTGEYCNGHLYGLPKIHKNATDPPLRPIISMTGTVTHDIAQQINS